MENNLGGNGNKMTVRDLEQLKSKVDQLKEDSQRAQGRLEETEKRLKEEFDVDSFEVAEKLLKELHKKEESAKQEYEEEFAAFLEKWGGELGMDEE